MPAQTLREMVLPRRGTRRGDVCLLAAEPDEVLDILASDGMQATGAGIGRYVRRAKRKGKIGKWHDYNETKLKLYLYRIAILIGKQIFSKISLARKDKIR